MRKIVVALAVLLTACQWSSQPDSTDHVATLEAPNGDQVSFFVEIADDAAERTTGLMFRETLAEDAGMLFVFEQEQSLAFWMKNTLIPLDILYFAANGEMVSWTTMVPCTADPCETYPSAGPAQYALEVPAGVVQTQGIEADWHLVLK